MSREGIMTRSELADRARKLADVIDDRAPMAISDQLRMSVACILACSIARTAEEHVHLLRTEERSQDGRLEAVPVALDIRPMTERRKPA